MKIKKVGINGQISLGKEFAGKQVQICKLDNQSFLIREGNFIPLNEKWLYKDDNIERLNRAIQWMQSSERKENLKEIENMVGNG